MFKCPLEKFKETDDKENDVLHICLNCNYSTVEQVFRHWEEHCSHERFVRNVVEEHKEELNEQSDNNIQ